MCYLTEINVEFTDVFTFSIRHQKSIKIDKLEFLIKYSFKNNNILIKMLVPIAYQNFMYNFINFFFKMLVPIAYQKYYVQSNPS